MSPIRTAEPTDEPLLRSLWEIGLAVDQEVPETHDHQSWGFTRERWMRPPSSGRVELLYVVEDDRPVGYAEVEFPLADNLHLAGVTVYVAAEHRRRGHGRALLDAGIARIVADGRGLAITGFVAATGTVSAGEAFARAHGFELAQRDVEKVLDVAHHADRWPAMLAEVEPASAAYRIESWAGPVPDAFLDAICALASGFVGELPLGDLELEDERWDGARIRERDARNAAAGRHEVTTLALAPDGSPAGYSVIIVDEERPQVGYQDATLVLPAHRGHRLGLRLKLVNQILALAQHPELRTIETGNAVDNEHMAAVNERLGFREVARWLEMQKRL